MRVVIAGGHGQIAQRLEKQLAAAGHQPVGLIRKPQQAADLEANGAEAVLYDLEQGSVEELAGKLQGAGAVVFAAGGGPGSGPERKESVDKNGAKKLADAAEQAGVRRYLMISSMGTDQADPDSDEPFQVYLRAKAAADEDLRSRDLDWTIFQPGGLTDDPGTGKVTTDPDHEPREIPRDDVAAALVVALENESTYRRQISLLTGDTPVPEALSAL